MFIEVGGDHKIVINALINKNIDLKEGVFSFSHECNLCLVFTSLFGTD